ncbi:PilW family protein [Alkalihalobacterium chitinilyticum]|uniref:Type II secretion system GspH family protein n=1 Tax=Alkalihalobacterium chitinilyticum TaxID=2980103 RepID=A0ABT5VAG0_9BACI|nr:type II secretion system protein [Alkalihalobacterium chitinilyticum]MDE5412434.1 type II secretion system GspH family protein [Alkalihalobacterium chitinilyticum]
MRNQRGITLVELLLTITIMGIVSAPVFLLVNSTMKVHQETSIDNQLQHEARFITQYISEKIRDGARIQSSADSWELRKGSEVFIRYNHSLNEVYLKDGDTVLSSHVEHFEVHPEPIENPVKYNVSLRLKNRDRTFQLETTVYHDANSRFKR